MVWSKYPSSDRSTAMPPLMLLSLNLPDPDIISLRCAPSAGTTDRIHHCIQIRGILRLLREGKAQGIVGSNFGRGGSYLMFEMFGTISQVQPAVEVGRRLYKLFGSILEQQNCLCKSAEKTSSFPDRRPKIMLDQDWLSKGIHFLSTC